MRSVAGGLESPPQGAEMRAVAQPKMLFHSADVLNGDPGGGGGGCAVHLHAMRLRAREELVVMAHERKLREQRGRQYGCVQAW